MSNRCRGRWPRLRDRVSKHSRAFRNPTESFPLLSKEKYAANRTCHFHEYSVELADLSHFNEIHRADVQFDGTFQLRDIRSGTYNLRVTTLGGTVIQQIWLP